ncbi:MAG: polyprenyl synthetase family protein [Anaerolineae bacterium]
MAHEFIQAEILSVVDWPELDLSIAAWVNRNHQSAYIDVWPALTFATTGGDLQAAVPLVALWLLHIMAARVFDDIQDNEGLDNPWQHRGVEQALPTGIALLTLANICLTHLQTDVETFKAVMQALGRAGTLAAKAQSHPPRDWSAQTLEPYFEHLIATTGQVFAAGAWAGARLNTTDENMLDALYQFGLNRGMEMAIISDCADLQPQNPSKLSDLTAGIYKLPVLYAVSLAEHPQQARLMKLLGENASLVGERLTEMIALLDEMGAVAWSLNLAVDFRNRATAALRILPDEVNEALAGYV